MPSYIEYELDENTTILVEAPEDESGGVVKASRGDNTPKKAEKTFKEAWKSVKVQAKMLIAEVEDLHVEEAEIKFGVNVTGQAGNVAIAQVGLGVNYEVTLKWKKAEKGARKTDEEKANLA